MRYNQRDRALGLLLVRPSYVSGCVSQTPLCCRRTPLCCHSLLLLSRVNLVSHLSSLSLFSRSFSSHRWRLVSSLCSLFSAVGHSIFDLPLSCSLSYSLVSSHLGCTCFGFAVFASSPHHPLSLLAPSLRLLLSDDATPSVGASEACRFTRSLLVSLVVCALLLLATPVVLNRVHTQQGPPCSSFLSTSVPWSRLSSSAVSQILLCLFLMSLVACVFAARFLVSLTTGFAPLL